MSEGDVVSRTGMPNTVASIAKDLKALGFRNGDVALVHSSLSRLGWVCGAEQAVIQGLQAAAGPTGTLCMPAQTVNSDPIEWKNPPVPDGWLSVIYNNMPAFDVNRMPARGMGRIAELFRTFPGCLRSNHPQVSFSAWGRLAADIIKNHPLTPQFGAESPLGKLYELDAKVLLLGAGYDACTCFHMGETLFDRMPRKRQGASILVGGERQWTCFEDFDYNSDDFDKLGEDFEKEMPVALGKVGEGDCRLFSLREAVDYATNWLPKNRP